MDGIPHISPVSVRHQTHGETGLPARRGRLASTQHPVHAREWRESGGRCWRDMEGVGEAVVWISIATDVVVRSMWLTARLAHNASLRDFFPSATDTPKAQ